MEAVIPSKGLSWSRVVYTVVDLSPNTQVTQAAGSEEGSIGDGAATSPQAAHHGFRPHLCFLGCLRAGRYSTNTICSKINTSSQLLYICMYAGSLVFFFSSLLQMTHQINYLVYLRHLGRITVYHTTVGAVF
jgi:hypothetical protein